MTYDQINAKMNFENFFNPEVSNPLRGHAKR